jgi:hypothetical protein
MHWLSWVYVIGKEFGTFRSKLNHIIPTGEFRSSSGSLLGDLRTRMLFRAMDMVSTETRPPTSTTASSDPVGLQERWVNICPLCRCGIGSSGDSSLSPQVPSSALQVKCRRLTPRPF